MADDATTTTATETKAPSIKELTEAIKSSTGKEVEPQNLRATLRNLVKKGDLTHEPRTRWEFSDSDIELVVAHYSKPEPTEGDEKPKAKKAPAKSKAKAKAEPEPEVEDDDDDLELEDI